MTDSLFTSIKDLIKYGADVLDSGDLKRDLIDAGLDASLMAFTKINPALAPLFSEAKNLARAPLNSAADQIIDMMRDWSVKG